MIALNPVLESMRADKPTQRPTYPIKIYCITWEYSDLNGDTVVKDIQKHALNAGVLYITRKYDSSKYSDDRDIITRLPAFHAYINGSYNRTFYPNTRPLQHIDECVEICMKREERVEARRLRWSNLFKTFVTWVRRLGHLETAMERYARDTKKVEGSGRFRDVHMVRVSNWD